MKTDYRGDVLFAALDDAQEFHRLRMDRRQKTHSMDEPDTREYVLFGNAKWHRWHQIETGVHFEIGPATDDQQ